MCVVQLPDNKIALGTAETRTLDGDSTYILPTPARNPGIPEGLDPYSTIYPGQIQYPDDDEDTTTPAAAPTPPPQHLLAVPELDAVVDGLPLSRRVQVLARDVLPASASSLTCEDAVFQEATSVASSYQIPPHCVQDQPLNTVMGTVPDPERWDGDGLGPDGHTSSTLPGTFAHACKRYSFRNGDERPHPVPPIHPSSCDYESVYLDAGAAVGNTGMHTDSSTNGAGDTDFVLPDCPQNLSCPQSNTSVDNTDSKTRFSAGSVYEQLDQGGSPAKCTSVAGCSRGTDACAGLAVRDEYRNSLTANVSSGSSSYLCLSLNASYYSARGVADEPQGSDWDDSSSCKSSGEHAPCVSGVKCVD